MWSFGVLAYHMFAEDFPFKGKDLEKINDEILHFEPDYAFCEKMKKGRGDKIKDFL